MNKAILMGRLTKDPELRTTQNNVSVCSFTLAIDRRFKNQHGERETDFIPVVAWRQTAEFAARYFSKGARMALVGSIQPRSWEDENGERRYITEVVADEVYFADSKRQQDDNYGNAGYSPSTGYSPSSGYSQSPGYSSGESSAPAPKMQEPAHQVGVDIPEGKGFMPEVDDTSLPFDL